MIDVAQFMDVEDPYHPTCQQAFVLCHRLDLVLPGGVGNNVHDGNLKGKLLKYEHVEI